ncbi:ankyrin repeat domain-containing protein SOWAHB [Discoglossus pictus]
MRMAKELSQEEVLDFLCQGGGKVSNASLLGHFKGFLRDPLAPTELLLKHREKFKRYVNSVAVVKQEGAVKYVVLRSRYMDLLGEDLRPPTPPPEYVDQAVHGEEYTAAQVGGGSQGQAQRMSQGGELVQIRTTDQPLPGQCWETINCRSHGPPSHETVSQPHSAPSLTPSPSNQTSKSSKLTSSPSSSCSPAHSPALAPNNHKQTPSPASSGHWRPVPAGDSTKEVPNPAFVNATYWDAQEQRQACMVCTELQAPHHHPVTTSQELNSYQGEHTDRSYPKLSASPPSSRYIHAKHAPPSSLLLRQDSGISQPDVQLADYHTDSPSPPLPDNDMRDMWMHPFPIFKSIRCQLSLQDLDDFVEQDSCGSDGSDSGEGGDCDTEHIEEDDYSSDSTKEKHVHYIEHSVDELERSPPNKTIIGPIDSFNDQQNMDPVVITDPVIEGEIVPYLRNLNSKSPYITKSFLTDQAPILFQLAGNLPKNKISTRAYEYVSSSDDEFSDRDSRKRRRPSRSKKSPFIPLVPPQPDIDRLLTEKPVSTNSFVVNARLPEQNQVQTQYAPKEKAELDIKKGVNFRSSSVPLDTMEHDWIVKSASGSWLQVYGMFTMDPQLALRKDFISGYTVLHWFAKHGCLEMFQKFMAGAKKVGIELDMNIKSNCGYTPLHIAAIHGHHKVATMLVEKLKVNVKLRDNSGKRAWQYLGSSTSGEVWQLLGAPRGKTIFSSRALNTTHNVNTQNTSSQLSRKTSLAAFLKPQHQKWKTSHNLPALREREIYSD